MNSKILLELVFWLVSFVLITLILLPIYLSVSDYPFYGLNIITILIAFHFIRSIFFLRHTWFSHSERWKAILFFLCIPILLYLIDAFYYFQAFRESSGVMSLVDQLPMEEQMSMSFYIVRMTIICWVGALVASIAFPLRLLQSIWLVRNRGRI